MLYSLHEWCIDEEAGGGEYVVSSTGCSRVCKLDADDLYTPIRDQKHHGLCSIGCYGVWSLTYNRADGQFLYNGR
jgi:hypothetical protein